MEKVLKQDLEDGREVSVAWEVAEHLHEDTSVEITAEEIIGAITDCGSMMDKAVILDALAGMREVFHQVRRDARKNYYRRRQHQYPRIPPKVAVCSSRHKGRKCKKIKK